MSESDFFDGFTEEEKAQVLAKRQAHLDKHKTVHPPRPRLLLRFGAEAAKPQSTGAVVQGVLHAGSLTLVYGPPKSGKSFLMTDLFASIAAGDDKWMERKIVKTGPVLYVTCEGHAGFWKRLKALTIRRWGGDSFPDRFVLAVGRPILLAFDKKGMAAPRPEDVAEAVDAVDRKFSRPPIAVCIDTVFRSFAPGNVNSSEHMSAYVDAFQQVIDQGVAGVLVHHATKSAQTPAGSVALIGAADTVIATANGQDDDAHTWEIEMAKDDGETEPRKFKLEVVDIGLDPDQTPASSCVVADLAETAAKTRGRPANVAEPQLLMRLLAEVVDDRGRPPNGDGGVPPMIPRVVDVDAWRAEYMRRNRPDDDDQTKRQAFRRLIAKLQTTNQIGVSGKLVWPLNPP